MPLWSPLHFHSPNGSDHRFMSVSILLSASDSVSFCEIPAWHGVSLLFLPLSLHLALPSFISTASSTSTFFYPALLPSSDLLCSYSSRPALACPPGFLLKSTLIPVIFSPLLFLFLLVYICQTCWISVWFREPLDTPVSLSVWYSFFQRIRTIFFLFKSGVAALTSHTLLPLF